MPFCTACGKNNPDDARFCSQCGKQLVDVLDANDSTATIVGIAERLESTDTGLKPVDAAAVEQLPSGSALLVVQRGPGAGQRFLLDADTVSVGRHPDSTIFLDDVTVSRRHVEFSREAASYRMKDLGSLNGTYVNRDRIDQVVLVDGDEVQIGKYRLVYFAGKA